ncbi:MAG: response regulator [candidate division KSB1 bacterium]|nr:response regulator [candidate division KSB1 bacterium]
MLKQLNYNVFSANTPGQAIELAKNHANTIHLLLTDVVMPEMNGKELSDHIKSLCPTIQILFMSGYTTNIIAEHGVLEEGVYFIPKPFSKKNLADKVRQALDQR